MGFKNKLIPLFMCVHMYMHVCVHVCMYMCVHVYMNVCVHAHVHGPQESTICHVLSLSASVPSDRALDHTRSLQFDIKHW